MSDIVAYRHKINKDLYLKRESFVRDNGNVANYYYKIADDLMDSINSFMYQDVFENVFVFKSVDSLEWLDKYPDLKVTRDLQKRITTEDGWSGIVSKKEEYMVRDFERVYFVESPCEENN